MLAIRWCGSAKVVDAKLDALVAANPKLALDAAAHARRRQGDGAGRTAIKDKLITAEEAAGATEVTVYTVANRCVQDGSRSGAGELADGVLILFILVLYVTMVYGPIAAILVEMFPTRIRYTGMSLPYHIGNGWFGGLLPATVFAMSAAAGDIYYGLWYPIAVAAMSLVIGMLFVRDTLGTDLHAKE